jgi:hypothetical protein
VLVLPYSQLSLDALAALGPRLRLWSAEDPALYTLVVELSHRRSEGGESEVLEYESAQVGFGKVVVTRSDVRFRLLPRALGVGRAGQAWLLGVGLLTVISAHSSEVGVGHNICVWCVECCHGIVSNTQVGFRQTEVKGGVLLHNGRHVMLRGVNRHEWDDVSGKIISEDHMIRYELLHSYKCGGSVTYQYFTCQYMHAAHDRYHGRLVNLTRCVAARCHWHPQVRIIHDVYMEHNARPPVNPQGHRADEAGKPQRHALLPLPKCCEVVSERMSPATTRGILRI